MKEYQFLIDYFLEGNGKTTQELVEEANILGLDGNKVAEIIQKLMEQYFITMGQSPSLYRQELGEAIVLMLKSSAEIIEQLKNLESEESESR